MCRDIGDAIDGEPQGSNTGAGSMRGQRRGLGLVCVCRVLAALALAQPALQTAAAAVLRLGVQDDAVPFAYRTRSGEAVGYAVQICQRIAARLARERGQPLQIEYVSVSSRTRLVKLLSGEVDLDCTAMGANDARRQLRIAFSRPIFVSDTAVLLRREGGLPSSLAQWLRSAVVSPLPVVTTAGSSAVRQLTALREDAAGAALRVDYGVDAQESIHRLLDGRASAFVMDRVLLAAQLAWADAAAERQGAALAITDWGLAPMAAECAAIAMRDGDTELQRAADATIAELIDGPELPALYARWFDAPIEPPRNLQLPAGAGQKRSLALPMPAGWRERLADPANRGCDGDPATTVGTR